MPITANCILWPFQRNAKGYGLRSLREEDGKQHGTTAHRWIYERKVGPIPRGLQCDHICERKRCVNPAHIRLVTPRENTLRGNSMGARNARKTTCVNGHPFDGVRSDGGRRCLTCLKQSRRDHYWKMKGRRLDRDK